MFAASEHLIQNQMGDLSVALEKVQEEKLDASGSPVEKKRSENKCRP